MCDDVTSLKSIFRIVDIFVCRNKCENNHLGVVDKFVLLMLDIILKKGKTGTLLFQA